MSAVDHGFGGNDGAWWVRERCDTCRLIGQPWAFDRYGMPHMVRVWRPLTPVSARYMLGKLDAAISACVRKRCAQ